jgi:chromosome segregation ATPase
MAQQKQQEEERKFIFTTKLVEEITSKIKKVNSDRRKLAAMKMILKEIAQHLDAVSFYKSQSKDTTVASKKLKEACDKIKKYKDEFFDLYIEAMTDVFGNMAPPATSSYTGASTRVKKKLEEGTYIGEAPIGYLNKPRLDRKKEKAEVYFLVNLCPEGIL